MLYQKVKKIIESSKEDNIKDHKEKNLVNKYVFVSYFDTVIFDFVTVTISKGNTYKTEVEIYCPKTNFKTRGVADCMIMRQSVHTAFEYAGVKFLRPVLASQKGIEDAVAAIAKKLKHTKLHTVKLL